MVLESGFRPPYSCLLSQTGQIVGNAGTISLHEVISGTELYMKFTTHRPNITSESRRAQSSSTFVCRVELLDLLNKPAGVETRGAAQSDNTLNGRRIRNGNRYIAASEGPARSSSQSNTLESAFLCDGEAFQEARPHRPVQGAAVDW